MMHFENLFLQGPVAVLQGVDTVVPHPVHCLMSVKEKES